jgi:hypothetical protein
VVVATDVSQKKKPMYKNISKFLNEAFEHFRRLTGTGSTKERRLLFFVNVLLLSVVLSAQGVSSAPQTGDDLWSLSFSDLTVAEALKELTRVTGISLHANRPPENRRLTKAYENETIEQIIRDVFRGKNYSLVWNYGEKGLESIGIWFFQEDSSPESTGGGVDRTRGWSVERNQDYSTTREVPSIETRQIPRKKPPVAIRALANRRRTEASEIGDEAIEGEDENETAEEDENEQARPEADEDEPAEEEAEAEEEPSAESGEDEENVPGDNEEQDDESSQR